MLSFVLFGFDFMAKFLNLFSFLTQYLDFWTEGVDILMHMIEHPQDVGYNKDDEVSFKINEIDYYSTK